VGGQLHAVATLQSGKRPSTYCRGGCLVPRTGLDGYGNSYIHMYMCARTRARARAHTHTRARTHARARAYITSVGLLWCYIWITKSDKFLSLVWFIIHCCHCLVLCSEVDRMIDDCLIIEMC